MEITLMFNGQPNNKRRCSSKVRTGCATCKIRHVKCDEQKPHCDKCVSSGRKCPGYDVFRVARTTFPRPGSRLTKSPCHLLPDATRQERFHFDAFQSCIIGDLCGIFDGSWWSPYVLKTAVAEPMILHAALAFASTKTSTTGGDAFAVGQHNKAIRCLQTCLNKADNTNPNIVLLTTLLLACNGFAHNDVDEAMLHLQGGAAMLSKIKDGLHEALKLGPATEGAAECCLVNAFRRLDLATTLSMTTRPFPRWFSHWVSKKQAPLDPPELDNVVFIRNRLERWTTEVVCLIFDTQQLGALGVPLIRNDYPLQVRVQEMIAASEQLLQSLNQMVTQVIPTTDDPAKKRAMEKAATLLRIQHTSASILLETSLADGCETVFDYYIDDFTAIVDLAAPLAPHFQYRSTAFTLDVGVVPALYFTICKCRDPKTRYRAIDLLSSLTHREGAWDAQESARSARKIAILEEKATAALLPGIEIKEAFEIPEMARVHQAYFDADTGENLVYCKRRRFESDGDWVYWEETVY